MAQGNPAFANQAPPPPAPETVPDPNQQLTQEQWSLQRGELDSLLTELSKSHAEQTNIQRNQQNNVYDPYNKAVNDAKAQAALQDVMDRRYGSANSNQPQTSIFERIDNLVRNSNTSEMLSLLDEKVGIARANRTAADERVRGANGAETKAQKATTEQHVSLATHYGITHSHATAPPLASLPEAGGVRKRETNRRKRLEDASMGIAVAGSISAGKADAELGKAVRSEGRVGDFHTDLEDITAYIRRDHEAVRADIDHLEQSVTDELDQWSIRRTSPAPGQEQGIRDDLEDMRLDIESLSPHDGLRAESLANLTRLRYRLESRGINQDLSTGSAQHDGRYTPDRGIILHRGTPNEVIIYDDGTTSRVPQGATTHVRRLASGQVYTPPVATIDLDAPRPVDAYGQPRTAAEVFKEWEANRTPESAANAHAALSHYVEGQQQQVNQQLSAIDTYRTGATERRDHIAQIRTDAQGRALTAVENQAIADAQAEITRLQGLEQTAQQNILTVRSRLNPANYWKNFLEVNTQRTETQTRGRFITKQVVAPVATLAPELRSDGAVVVNQATINGRRRDQWHIWPDGMAAFYDGRQWHRFDSAGRPI
jgi:hypothetical protein